MQENRKVMMYDVDKNDNPIKSTGRISWESRSVAVVVILTNESNSRFILEKRGTGCPDEVGKLVFPCGYLAWGEDLKDAVKREVYEETGLIIDKGRIKFLGINDSPKAEHENITICYKYEMTDEEMDNARFDLNSSDRGGEREEVSAILVTTKNWILRNPEEMGFGHDRLVKAYC